jgi:hypothetical protein
MALAEFERSLDEVGSDPWGEACLVDRGLEAGWDAGEDEHSSAWSDDVREYLAHVARETERRHEAVDWARQPTVGRESEMEPVAPALADQFQQLASLWRAETDGAPFVVTRATHWAYQRIIGMGPDVLPLIFSELSRQPDHWFWALNAITGEDPADGTTRFEEAAERWLSWGRSEGLVPEPVRSGT